ncbi:hypothetical protein [Bosea lathyri]|uniref:Uncharacterized protein n=1 Tax=Bosea lathyri TaxID=1036778 RepID=A0A1H6BX51_9HYPH|nr:hypothetical protein [Bosea lathyri]SEG65035.1 hypothetical protein SAMN04488115_108146 [Bosea lathyri]
MAGSVRRNQAYRGDPYIAKATENLAELFAPPSGADASGWANAGATREKAARIAELYAGAAGDADRQAVIADLYDPTQSYKALDMNNATTRRGQDVTSFTSRSNNSADNARALEERRLQEEGLGSRNVLDNETKIQVGANSTRGNTIASLYGALNPGQIRPEVPADVASTIGLPTMGMAQGAPKPLSRDEVLAAALGQTPIATQQGLALAGPGTQNVVRDGVPVVESNAGAIGQRAFVDKGAQAKAANGQFVLADGTAGPAVQTPDGQWKHAQTGALLPPDARVTNMATPQGSNTDVGIGKTVTNDIDKQLLDIAVAKDTAVELRNLIAKSPASQGVVGWMRGTAQNVVQTGGEVGAYFGGNLAKVGEAIKNGTADAGLAGAFDPSIPAIEMMANLLAFQYAKTTTGERLSNEMLKNAKAALGLDGLDANQANSLARINQAVSRIEAQQGILTRARGGGVAAVSGAAPAAPTVSSVGQGRMRFDENGNPL